MSKDFRNNTLKRALADALPTLGFIRKQDSWYKYNPETTFVVNAQKSQYSNKYYLNIAVCITALRNEKFPREEHCHIRERAEDVAANRAEAVRALNLEDSSMSDESRYQVLVSLLKNEVTSFFGKYVDAASIGREIRCGNYKGLLPIEAKKYALSKSAPSDDDDADSVSSRPPRPTNAGTFVDSPTRKLYY